MQGADCMQYAGMIPAQKALRELDLTRMADTPSLFSNERRDALKAITMPAGFQRWLHFLSLERPKSWTH